MPKILIKDLEAFAVAYPHLVRTVTEIKPDKRKINTAMRDGWKLEGVDVVEGHDDEEIVDTATEKPQEEQKPDLVTTGVVESASPSAAASPAALTGDVRTLGQMMGITSTAPASLKPDEPPETFKRYEGEDNRSWNRRYQLHQEAEALERKAREGK